MAIHQEIWARDIANNIFPDNSFLLQSKDDTAWVIEGKKAHLPQAGASPSVELNRNTFPAVAAQRVDTTIEYDLDEFTTSPTHIRDTDEVETSYEKRMSVLEDHLGSLDTAISYVVASRWAPTLSGRILRTTGADRTAMAPSATGTRKKITVADFQNAKRILDKDDVPQEDRFVLLPSEMYNDLLEIDAILTSDKMGTANLASGAVGRLLGFQIYVRSNALIYNNAATPAVKAYASAGAGTDNAAALFWQKQHVRRAKGSVNVYSDENNPQFYGSIFSTASRAGGSKTYTTSKGTVVLVEAHGA